MPPWRSTAPTWRSTPARSSPSWGPAGRASRPCCTASPASSPPTPARCGSTAPASTGWATGPAPSCAGSASASCSSSASSCPSWPPSRTWRCPCCWADGPAPRPSRRPHPGSAASGSTGSSGAGRASCRAARRSGSRMARALVARPDVVFADEPTGSLDSLAGEQVMDLLVDAAREQGATVVLVTHEPRVAAYADREVVVRDGRVPRPGGGVIRLAARLTAGGGREALVRLVLTGAGLALAVAMLLVATVVFPALHAHDVRRAWTETSEQNLQPAQDERHTDPLLWRLTEVRFGGDDIVRVDLAARGRDAPVPPGLAELPGPGELAVSPRLAELLAETDAAELRRPVPGAGHGHGGARRPRLARGPGGVRGPRARRAAGAARGRARCAASSPRRSAATSPGRCASCSPSAASACWRPWSCSSPPPRGWRRPGASSGSPPCASPAPRPGRSE